MTTLSQALWVLLLGSLLGLHSRAVDARGTTLSISISSLLPLLLLL